VAKRLDRHGWKEHRHNAVVGNGPVERWRAVDDMRWKRDRSARARAGTAVVEETPEGDTRTKRCCSRWMGVGGVGGVTKGGRSAAGDRAGEVQGDDWTRAGRPGLTSSAVVAEKGVPPPGLAWAVTGRGDRHRHMQSAAEEVNGAEAVVGRDGCGSGRIGP
jgi:hypothetical protein